jgi:TolB-like protein
MMTKGKTPVVMVGRFKNDSSEHIDTNIISSIMEMSIFNSGKLDFVSSGDVRDELRAERLDQQEHASPQTMARLRSETGADYLMTGSVRSIVDREGNQTVRRYYVTAELPDIETNQRLWIAQNSEIKKLIRVRNNTL